MTRAAISDSSWAEMTTAQQVETVRAGRATLRQVVAGLLDGADQLREACREFLAHTDASLTEIRIEDDPNGANVAEELLHITSEAPEPNELIEDNLQDAFNGVPKKRRPGLPPGYTPRLPPH